MNMKMRKFIIFIIFIIVITVITPGVFAQSVLPLTVAPARQEITVNPGESSAVNVRFYNFSEAPVSGIVRIADFIVDNSQGTPRIIEDINQVSPRFSAQTWLTIPYDDQITIAPNDKVTLQAKINVPVDAHPGGRYVAVYFEPSGNIPQAVGGKQEAGTGVSTRIASLVYIKVAGPTTEKALISRFFTPGFFEYGPIKVETQILNRSDYHIRPHGVITMSNVFGAPVDQTNLREENIFPDVVRNYENSLGKKWMLGKYKLNFTASYGEKGQVLEAFTYVWVFPWRVALAVILTIIILILIISNLYKNIVVKETSLEEEVKKEQVEIEKLKTQLRKKG
ncbi:MAG: hypothetical protein UW37_C0001G0010 [Candidatus Gottesmanbacteria bacterium GW2011_GWA2_44_17]|uniref:DUF916 domain-containing protein n=1 Tax=Candidatus Gottesmanbacteria bacterium GW2011_GWA2_44_17 TaxID=1618444 RepID=A0A0G1HM49_9BACT|nr:MAG: hypothetical protein UW37_C0001G0010 [Candidatus Gottesmanbacteria bacterium GW2011_GWA2_44_17]